MFSQTNITSLNQVIQKYNLDISIIDSNKLLNGTRLDAEHYQHEYLDFREKFNHLNRANFSDIVERKVTTGHTPSMKEERFYGGNIAFIKTDNVRENKISGDFSHYLSEDGNNILSKTSLKEGDILVTIIGATYDIVGRAAMIGIENLPANINQNVALIRIDKKKANHYYVNILLNSKYGKLCLHSMARQTEQVNLNCTEIENITIPLPSPTLQQKIAELVQEAHRQRELSKSLYAEAEKVLLDELGLNDWQSTEENIAEKMSEEVSLYGRCDAEFFQPKYDEILEKIKKYKGGYDTIRNLISIAGKQMKIEAEKEYQYCELADIDPTLGTVGNFTQIFGADLPSRARMKIEKGDVVVSSVAGSSQKVALIQSEDDNLVASTGFFVLKPKAFNSETNLVLMKSLFMQMFLERSARGMILSATNQDDFKNLIIPNILSNAQSVISEKIIASHDARKISKNLLEKAKRAVEIFIEEDEVAAEKWLNS